MTIEWAKDSDARTIQALLQSDGLTLLGGDWTGLGRTWLLARERDGIKACIAYHPGRPIARLDFLAIDKEVTGLSKARLVRDILEAALAVCALHGSSFVAGVVPYYLEEYGAFLSKRGGQRINDGWLFCASVTDALVKRTEVHGRRIKNHNHDNGHPDTGRDRVYQAADQAGPAADAVDRRAARHPD
jgi:hypothetical protein